MGRDEPKTLGAEFAHASPKSRDEPKTLGAESAACCADFLVLSCLSSVFPSS